MAIFPDLEAGLFNGWLLAAVFYLVYAVLLLLLPRPVVARLSERPRRRGAALAFLGISVALGLIVIGVIGGHARIVAEEKVCLAQSGQPYRAYMQRAPRYFLFF